MGDRARGRVLMVTSALLWGLAGVCIKSITWGTASIITVRSVISLTLLMASKRSLRVSLTRRNLLGGLACCLTGVLYVQAIKLTTAGTAIVLQYVAPILVFLFEVVFRGKKAKVWEVALTACVFLGIVLSFADAIDMTRILGNLLALLSGVTFATQIIMMNDPSSNSQDCIAIGNMMAFLLCLPLMFFEGKPALDAGNIVWMLILSVFQYGLPNILYAKGCKLLDDIESSLLLTIEPVFNPIPVAIVCGERMGLTAMAGAAVVIASVTLYAVMPALLDRRTRRAEL